MKELELHIDHITLSVADFVTEKSFYEALLEPLGLELIAEFNDGSAAPVCAFGVGRKGTFWLAGDGQQLPSAHVAFRASSRRAVRDFYKAGIAAGGVCNGPPGIREAYHPEYYAAFVRDPEGHNIEALTFEVEETDD